MLNHALDDIEVFVSLLQKSAAASQQLTLRHSKKRNQANGRHRGTGIMEVRARLPPKDRFIDAFQKFRFSFNLLVSAIIMVTSCLMTSLVASRLLLLLCKLLSFMMEARYTAVIKYDTANAIKTTFGEKAVSFEPRHEYKLQTGSTTPCYR